VTSCWTALLAQLTAQMHHVPTEDLRLIDRAVLVGVTCADAGVSGPSVAFHEATRGTLCAPRPGADSPLAAPAVLAVPDHRLRAVAGGVAASPLRAVGASPAATSVVPGDGSAGCATRLGPGLSGCQAEASPGVEGWHCRQGCC
jgi:hypothetical protein